MKAHLKRVVTHVLDIADQCYVNDHPFKPSVVRVKRAVACVERAEADMARARRELEVAVASMNSGREE